MTSLAKQKAAILEAISQAEQVRHGDRSITNRSLADLREALKLIEAQEAAANNRRRSLRFSVANFSDE